MHQGQDKHGRTESGAVGCPASHRRPVSFIARPRLDKELEEGVAMERKERRPRRLKVLRSIALATKGATSLPLLVLVVLGLLVFMETRMYRAPTLSETDANACTPKVINANNIEYHSGHRYYSALKDIGSLPPVIREEHARLCSKINRYKSKYEYCLPISGRKDMPFCTAADRTDLLNIQVKDICYASVLHMLLVEVYEELQAKESDPFLAFGSLLGAVRNGSMIPFTEDVDIGYVGELEAVDKVKLALRKKGYHMFYMGIWRVCVAPTHPLAGHLYDPELPITENFAVPYVDLYMLKPTSSGDWDMQELEGSNGRLLPDDKVQPFSQVTINGMPFDTVHDPKFFLRESYGDDYMTPKPREEEDGSNRREKPQIR